MLTTETDVQTVQDQFVQMLPEIQSRASATFRHLDPDAREEAVAETLAMCWKSHLHCASNGKAIGASSLAHYAMLGVKSGRSLCGQNSTDVLAPRTQVLGRVVVESLVTTGDGNALRPLRTNAYAAGRSIAFASATTTGLFSHSLKCPTRSAASSSSWPTATEHPRSPGSSEFRRRGSVR